MRTLWVQTALSLALCFLVLASAVALVETDRRINRSIQNLTDATLFDNQLETYKNRIEERYPPPSLVVFVSIAGLRRDRLTAYGYEAGSTPHLDALASESNVFENVLAQASHALVSNKSVLTGQYPSTLMLEGTGADLVTLTALEDPGKYIERAFVGAHTTLPAQLRANGYRTAAFSDGGWVSRENGFARGFEHFEENRGGLATTLDRVREHLYEWRGERAFVFLHSSQLVCPYPSGEPSPSQRCEDHSSHAELSAFCQSPSKAWNADDLDALSLHYDGAVSGVDDHLGRLVGTLKELGVYEDSLLVVTGSHGVSLGERGTVGSGGLALEQLMVPLVVKFPGNWRVAPDSNAEPIELVDVMPTLLSSCGQRPPRGLDGQSFLSIALRNVRGRDYLFAQTTSVSGRARPASAARRTLLAPGKWQVIHDPVGNRVEFYALAEDPLALEPIRDLTGIEIPPILRRLLGQETTQGLASANRR